jgi:hypothetical protein
MCSWLVFYFKNVNGGSAKGQVIDSQDDVDFFCQFILIFSLVNSIFSLYKKKSTARFNSPSRTSSVSQTATGGGETAGERHSGNVVSGGIPRGDLFLWICLPPAPKGALTVRLSLPLTPPTSSSTAYPLRRGRTAGAREGVGGTGECGRRPCGESARAAPRLFRQLLLRLQSY